MSQTQAAPATSRLTPLPSPAARSESRGTDGVVVGTYEYLDPLKRVVKVDYTADQNGFHPNVQGPVPQAPRVSRRDVFTHTHTEFDSGSEAPGLADPWRIL